MTKSKSIFTLSLLLLATVAFAPSAQAATQEVAGVVWTYTVVSNAVVIGDFPNTNYTSAISRDTSGEIVIPDTLGGLPVVDIAPYAFSGCTNITAVTIPDAVTNISMGAFAAISIPFSEILAGYKETLNTVGGTTTTTVTPVYEAVEGLEISACERLANLTLPRSLQVISAEAFMKCANLTSVVFRGSVGTIENGAFANCTRMGKVSLPDGLRHLGGEPSTVSRLLTGYKTTVTTSGGTTTKTLTPTYVETWSNTSGGRSSRGVFEGCENLQCVTLPNWLEEIGPRAFKRCRKISTLTLPDTVRDIFEGAFSECTSLSEFKFTPRAEFPAACSRGEDGLFFGCLKLHSVSVPSGVTSLPNYAFANCVSLQALNFAGDKPTVGGNELLIGTPADLIVNARSDALGWYDPFTYERLSRWQHRRVAYDEVLMKEADEVDEDAARESLMTFLELLPVAGASLSEDEKLSYWYSIQNIIDHYPALLDCAATALNTLGVELSEAESNAFLKWSFSVASSRLNPANGSSTKTGDGGATCGIEAKLTVTNVVLHYVVNSITPDLAVPITKDTGLVSVMTEVMGGNIAIPDSWATNYPAFKTAFGSDFAASLMKPTGKVDAGGKPMLVWQDFVAGTDPTDEDDVFRASVTMVDGKPVVSYTPELNDAEKAKRKYTTWGKVRLQDVDWAVISNGHEGDYNFFKVTVEMR